jgi:hypothetical protein
MSAFFSWQHAIRKAQLEPTTKLVLYTIATYMAADGTGCYPSYATIADGTGLGRSTVIAHVNKAIDAGFLTKATRRDDDGEHTSNLYQAVMPGGSPLAGPPSPAAGPRVVQQRDPKYPSEQTKEHSPHTPKGAGDWESDFQFMKLCEAYAALNASRVDFGKAWEVWKLQSLSEHASALLDALPTFSKLDQWRKEGGKFIPRLSKWLADGSWRSQAKVSKVVTEEELAARAKVIKAGQDAWARMETAKRFNREPLPDDVKAFELWQALSV